MRRVIMNEQLTLDGVMQAPGSGRGHKRRFQHGGWAMHPADA